MLSCVHLCCVTRLVLYPRPCPILAVSEVAVTAPLSACSLLLNTRCPPPYVPPTCCCCAFKSRPCCVVCYRVCCHFVVTCGLIAIAACPDVYSCACDGEHVTAVPSAMRQHWCDGLFAMLRSCVFVRGVWTIGRSTFSATSVVPSLCSYPHLLHHHTLFAVCVPVPVCCCAPSVASL